MARNPHKAALTRRFVGDVKEWNPALADSLLRTALTMKIGELEEAVGGLSKPDKMPCNAFNLPAISTCKVGSILARKEGTVCFECYATKGRYVFQECIDAQERRLSSLDSNPEQWAACMAALLRKKRGKRATHFRWHDSGEVRGPNHRDILIWVAENAPDVKFWLPSREYATWKGTEERIPDNLCVRLSAHMVGVKPPAIEGFPTSTVGWTEAPAHCPAPSQGGRCEDCRRCWDKSFVNVDYFPH